MEYFICCHGLGNVLSILPPIIVEEWKDDGLLYGGGAPWKKNEEKMKQSWGARKINKYILHSIRLGAPKQSKGKRIKKSEVYDRSIIIEASGKEVHTLQGPIR